MTTPQAHSPPARPPAQAGSDPCLDAARVALRAAGAREVHGHRVLAPGVHIYRGLTATGSARVVVVEAEGGIEVTVVGRAQARRMSAALKRGRPAPKRTDVPALSMGQAEVLDWLIEGLRSRHRTLTIREIAAARGVVSAAGICQTLDALQAKGYIERVKHAPSVRILRWPDGAVFRLVLERGEEAAERPASAEPTHGAGVAADLASCVPPRPRNGHREESSPCQ